MEYRETGETITINNPNNYSLKNLTIYGNTLQETTEGKNLLPQNVNSFTSNGITFTKNNDGTYTLNGTSTGEVILDSTGFSILGTGKSAKLFQLSGTLTGNIMHDYYNGWANGVRASINSEVYLTSGITYTRARIYMASGVTCNNLVIGQMIANIGELTEFEPYTNGASPNPSYPQQLKSVKARNLLDVSKSVAGYVNHNDGSLVSSTASMTSDYIELLSDKVTFSSKYDTLSSTNNRSFGFYDKDKNFISAVYFTQTNKIQTFTKPTNARYMRVTYDKNCYDVQLEEGSIVTNYVPYGYIRCQNNNGINNIEVEQGGISSSNGSLFDSVNRVRTKDYIEYSEFNILDVAKGINEVAIHFYDENKTWLSTLNNWYGLPYEITFPSNAKYVKFVFRRSDDSNITSNEVEGVHLYNQFKQVDFYLGNEQLRKIGDLKDKLEVDLNTGEYFKTSVIGEVVLDGTESGWQFNESNMNRAKVYISQGNPASSRSIMLSNYFHYISSGHEVGGGFIHNSFAYLYYPTSITTLEEWKTWLSNNNTIINYPLNSSTRTKLGTLTTEELSQLRLFSGYNDISVSANLDSLIELTYVESQTIRYILDDNGYIEEISCSIIECSNKTCTEYIGLAPNGYETLEEWAQTANIRAYKIENGILVYDSERAAALEVEWELCNKKILWGEDKNSGWFMNNSQTATLSESISDQKHGIVLVFCYYNGESDTNWGWQSFFVPKELVALTGSGHTFNLVRGKFANIGTKYLYILDDRITGHADNTATGTNNGITYQNNRFVLRYVIGV